MVYVTSDTHGAFDIHKINPREFKAAEKLTSQDYLLICGDFGCVWDGGSSDRFWLNWLESLPWTTLFIDGNHENFDVLSQYPIEEWNGGKVRRIRSNILYLMRGEVFHFDSKSWLALGGGYSHDQTYRTQGVNWWPEEIFTKEEAERARRNLEKAGGKVDVVLSHDVFSAHPFSNLYETDLSKYSDDQVHQQEFLEEMRRKTDYSIWLCGHYHRDSLDFFDGRPCRVLFDDVVEIDDLIEEARQKEAMQSTDSNSMLSSVSANSSSADSSC